MADTNPLEELRAARERMRSGGGEKRIEAQHKKGKYSVRERISRLFDTNSFIEHQSYATSRSTDFGMEKNHFYGDGVVTGSGKIEGRQLFVAAQDFTVLGGSLGEMQAMRISEAQELAIQNRCPFVQVNDSGGARIQEGILSLHGYGRIFRNNTLASGVIPQISVILGPCAGGAVYSPAITDFVLMVDGVSNMYITGPDVIKTVTGEEISHEELGGADAHCARSGVAHFRFPDEDSCIAFLKRLLSYLPAHNQEYPPDTETTDPADRTTPRVRDIVPQDEKQAYNVLDVIHEVVDADSFIEVQAEFAKNVVIGFAKLSGRTVGLFANQPSTYAAAMNIDASDKAARFLRFCDSFNIPIVSLVDVPGFMPGVREEHGGIIRHGAKVLYAIAEATVPKIALVMRKAYGGAYISMASKGLGYDRVLSFPSAQIAVMGPEGAAGIVYRRDIRDAADSEAMRTEKIREFKEQVANPFVAAELGYVDDIIDPADTRIELIRSLGMLAGKRERGPSRKHGNIPL